jgi:hypothetical protein
LGNGYLSRKFKQPADSKSVDSQTVCFDQTKLAGNSQQSVRIKFKPEYGLPVKTADVIQPYQIDNVDLTL